MRRSIPILAVVLLVLATGTAWMSGEGEPVPEGHGIKAPPPVLPTASKEVEAQPVEEEPEPAGPPSPEPSSAPSPGKHVSLFVEVVSAETGRPLKPKRVLVTESAAVNHPIRTLTPVQGGFRLPELPIPSWGFCILQFLVEPPEGYVMEDRGQFRLEVDPTPFTREIHARIIAWPEADLTVTVRKSSGHPAPNTRIPRVIIDNGTRAVRASLTDAKGETRIFGLPSIPGEPIRVVARRVRRMGLSPILHLGRSTEALSAEVFLPPRPGDEGLFFVGSGGCDGCSRDPAGPPEGGSAGLRVEARRIDGRPANGALVAVSGRGGSRWGWKKYGRADDFGNVRFDNLPPGAVEVQIREPEFVMSKAQAVELFSGRTVDALVTEDDGVPLAITITDKNGRALSGVQLTLAPENGVDFAWVTGDRERYGFFTDVDGRLTVPRLPEGKVRITAELGSRSMTFDLEAGGEERLVFTE